jgi:hypothetical protein
MVEEKPYIGMLGYTDEGRPFMALNVDKDDAEEKARNNDLSEYLLVPGHKDYSHHGYIRTAPGVYEWTYCRVVAFCHLLNTKHRWVPREENLKAGRLFDHNPLKSEAQNKRR